MVIFFFFSILVLVLILFKKAYFLSGKHPAALGAAAPGRNAVQLYDAARTYFKQRFSDNTTGQSAANRCDRSADTAPSRRPAAALTWTTTNADQPEPEAKLNGNTGVIYQARQAD